MQNAINAAKLCRPANASVITARVMIENILQKIALFGAPELKTAQGSA
ncbi:MAG: hypothetical protein KDB79_07905 [Acidobacteria bacterium]|nr:hypothetical protein [Acidobacteriota bacterium]